MEGLEEETELARQLGLPASLTRETGLPFEVQAAMRFDGQAQFHPTRYVKGLAATLPGDGCLVFEQSRVIDWDPHRIATAAGQRQSSACGHGDLSAARPDRPLLHGKLPAHAPGDHGPGRSARVPDGMYISMESPRHSTRGHVDDEGQAWMIFTGPSFTHGDVEKERESFADIERFAAEHFGVAAEYRWTNEDYTPMDHAPFIGWSSSSRDGYLVATGFNAWGISTGTAAGTLIADLVEGKDNSWSKLFNAARIKPVASAGQFAAGTAATASHLIGGYLASKPRSFDELAAGEGAVLKVDGHNVAGFRDEQGEIHAVSAVCTHMGCLVGWNPVDRTWDCPCHGSRFALHGDVIHGPAVKPLAPYSAKEGSGETVGVEEVARPQPREHFLRLAWAARSSLRFGPACHLGGTCGSAYQAAWTTIARAKALLLRSSSPISRSEWPYLPL